MPKLLLLILSTIGIAAFTSTQTIAAVLLQSQYTASFTYSGYITGDAYDYFMVEGGGNVASADPSMIIEHYGTDVLHQPYVAGGFLTYTLDSQGSYYLSDYKVGAPNGETFSSTFFVPVSYNCFSCNASKSGLGIAVSNEGQSDLEFLYLSFNAPGSGALSESNDFGVPYTPVASYSYNFTVDQFAYSDDLKVGSVPEASTWAMMLLGFGGLGALSYRRKRAKPALAATA